jgi:hypothetical protein
VVAALIFGAMRYGGAVNPVTAYAVSNVGLYTLFSAFVGSVSYGANSLQRFESSPVMETFAISIMQFLGFLLPFVLRPRQGEHYFAGPVRSSADQQPHFSYIKFAILATGMVACFAGLLMSDGRTLWLTDPRTAYQLYRTGVGHYWCLMQWFMMSALLYFLWGARPPTIVLVLAVGVFAVGAYFTGSKAAVLTVLVAGIIYYNFYIRQIPALVLGAFALLLGIGGVAGLIIIHGIYESMSEALVYFDYFANTVEFVARKDEFDLFYGKGIFSSLYFYVPRGLYPDKPFVYGLTHIQGVLWPGLAEQTYTPGLLSWSLAYLDFGIVGAFLDGLIEGIIRKTTFEFFLARRNNFLAFILALHFAIFPMWSLAPMPLGFAWSLALGAFVSFSFGSRTNVLNQSLPGQGQPIRVPCRPARG